MKISKRSLFVPVVFLLCVSCGRNQKNSGGSAQREIRFDKILIDTIDIALDNTSYVGFSGATSDAVYFLDELMSYLYTLSSDGEVTGRYLGLGRGPGELPIRSSSAACITSDNTLYVLGGSYDIYSFGELKNRKRHNIKVSGPKSSYESSTAYTLLRNVVMRANNGKIFYNVIGNNDAVDPIEQKDYFDKAHLLLQIDTKSMEARPVGKYSKYYRDNYTKLRHMIETYYDLDPQGNFYISHQADSSVYLYDKDFSLITQFGLQGRDMDTEYSDPSPSEDKFNAAFKNDLAEKGYYYGIKYVDGPGLLFRSYKKGKRSSSDGLQVYENGTLIADVDVPADFKVAGYVDGYFVTEIIADEDNGTLTLYRFKLR